MNMPEGQRPRQPQCDWFEKRRAELLRESLAVKRRLDRLALVVALLSLVAAVVAIACR
jgi:hypothetical protein